MRKSVLGIRHTGCPVTETSAEFPTVNQHHFSRVEQEDGNSRRLFRAQADPEVIDEFLAAFRDHDVVRMLERVSGSEKEGTVYCSVETHYHPNNPSVLQLIEENNCYYHPTVTVQKGVEYWVLYTEQKATVNDIIAELERHDNVLEMYQTVDLSRSSFRMHGLMTLHARLTESQRQAMEAALELGYYEDGTDATMEDIGAALDLHETTAWEHLKKAENAILSEVGERLFSELR
ncbi:MAG: helix-turn-helix domain-containing protein [Halolamina sp.]